MNQVGCLLFEVVQELPAALLVGAKKAGTGALSKFLSTHPDISFAPHEIKFFNHPWNYIRHDYRIVFQDELSKYFLEYFGMEISFSYLMFLFFLTKSISLIQRTQMVSLMLEHAILLIGYVQFL